MSKQVSKVMDVNLGANRSGALIRAVYYSVIIGIGLMLAFAVYLAR